MNGKNSKPFNMGEKAWKRLKNLSSKRHIEMDSDLPRPIGMDRLLDKAVEYPEWMQIEEKLLKEPRLEKIRFR